MCLLNNAYYLLHKNKKLATFVVDGDNILRVKINTDEDCIAHLPLGYTNELRFWLKNRGIPVARFKEAIQSVSQTAFDYMLSNYGLSLTDSYWICPVEFNITWEQINLYTNPFFDTLSLDLYVNSDDENIKRITPSATLQGALRKKWIVDKNGIRILVKGNFNNGCIQSISEVFATQIYTTQPYKVNNVNYNFIRLKVSGQYVLGCCCPAFTTENIEFVSAYDLVKAYKQDKGKNTFQFYKYLLECLTQQKYDTFYDMMLMVDFVITNTDRHFNNFGVLRDADTLQILCPAPIFDNGNSLFYKQAIVPTGKQLLQIEVTSFKSKEVKLLKEVKNRGLLDVRYLPSENVLYTLLQYDNTINEQRREKIVKAYKEKIQYILDFQNGADIWKREYYKSI